MSETDQPSPEFPGLPAAGRPADCMAGSRPPAVLASRARKVLAIDAAGLQASESRPALRRAKGKHLVLSVPHTQPPVVMENSGLVDRLASANTGPRRSATRVVGTKPWVEAGIGVVRTDGSTAAVRRLSR